MYRDALPWAVQKRLNQSWCCLGFGLGLAKAACIRWRAHWRNLVNTTEPSMCGSDAACCQSTLTTCSELCQVRPVYPKVHVFDNSVACLSQARCQSCHANNSNKALTRRLVRLAVIHKKLIRRWDSERELFSRRHCTRICWNNAK